MGDFYHSVDLDGLRKHIQDLHWDVAEEEVEDIKTRGVNIYDRDVRKCLASKLKALVPGGGNRLKWVYDSNTGDFTDDPCEITCITKAHWAEVWRDKGINAEALEDVLQSCDRRIQGANWDINLDM